MLGDIHPRHLSALMPVLESMESEGARVKQLKDIQHGDGGVTVTARFYLPTDYAPLDEDDE